MEKDSNMMKKITRTEVKRKFQRGACVLYCSIDILDTMLVWILRLNFQSGTRYMHKFLHKNPKDLG